MKSLFFSLLFWIVTFSNAQDSNDYSLIDQKMETIPDKLIVSSTEIANFINANFTTESEKIRAAFYWIASNISYDVVGMGSKRQLTIDERINKTLESKKGVCMNYAYVFKDITTKLGIETILIEGYTKSYEEIASDGHMWCASKLNGVWYLFDPTWGAGYVDKRKFFKKLDNKYYKAEPKSFITSHMPFDFLWQFSNYPISNQEFYDGKIEAENKREKFDFLKEIDVFKSLSESDKAAASAARIEKNGLKNKLVSDRWGYEKKRSEYEKNHLTYKDQLEYYNKTEKINKNINQANKLFTQFLNYKTRRFIPLILDENIKDKIQIPYDLIIQCQNDQNELKNIQKEYLVHFDWMKNLIDKTKNKIEIELAFVNQYLSKDKTEREKMFLKTVQIKK